MVEEVKCPECGLAEGHAIMCGSKDYRRKKRKLSRNDPAPSVVKDGATGEGDRLVDAIRESANAIDNDGTPSKIGLTSSDLRGVADQLAAARAEILELRALQSTIDRLHKEAKKDREQFVKRLAAEHQEVQRLKSFTEQLAAANAEITTWQQQCDSVQQTNDAMAKRLLRQEAEIERLKCLWHETADSSVDLFEHALKQDAEIARLKNENTFHIAQMVKGDTDNAALGAVLAQCEGAIKGVIKEADRKTDAFNKAREALSAIARLSEGQTT